MAVWTAAGEALAFGAGDAYGVSLAADGYGGFKAFWTQAGGDASGTAVIARRYGSDMVAGADRVINISTAGDQTTGAVVALSDGSSAYVWTDASGVDDSGLGIKTSWFYSDSVSSSWEYRVNPGIAGDQVSPVVASLYGVYYAVGWTDRGVPSGAGVRVVFYDDRTRIGNLVALGDGDRVADQLDLTSDDDRLIATWRERAGTGDTSGTIRSQYVGAYGTIGEAITLGTGTGNAHMVVLADGRLAAVWDVIESNGSAGVRARIFHADGTPWGAEFAVNPRLAGQQSDAAIVALPAGGFAIFWTDRTAGQEDVVGQTFDNGGMRYGEELRIGGAGDQYDAVVTMLTSGDLLVSWTDRGADGDRDLLAQRYAVAAAPAPVGSGGGDVLTGSAGDDAIDGLGGDDVIDGTAGNDRLSGGAGDDRLVGGTGDDILHGDDGNDTLRDDAYNYQRVGLSTDVLDGGSGDDVIAVTRSNDPAKDIVTIIGGAGSDDLSFHGAGSTLTIDAGDGDDIVHLYLSNADAVVTLGAGRDVVRLEEAFPDFFREPTLRLTDFAAGAGGDRLDLSEIAGRDAFRTGQLVLRQMGDDVALAGQAPDGAREVTLAVFAGMKVAQLTADNFSGMPLPELVEIGPGAVYENSAALVGLPAVLLSGDGAVLRNLAGGSIEKAREDASDPRAAAIVITGAEATIENAAGGQIRGQGGGNQAILGSAHDDTVRNAGVIRGWVRLAGGDDVYEERGRGSNGYDRYVDLGAGDDRAAFDLKGMRDTFVLSALGGAGEDRVELTNIGAAQQIRFNGVEGVETIALSGAAGAQVTLSNTGALAGTLALGAGMIVTIQPNTTQSYTGPARGTVLLNGGTFNYGPGFAFDRIVGSEAAERVATQALFLSPNVTATATNSVDLGGGDDTFVLYYGNTAPLSVEGGAGRDTLYATAWDYRLDLSAFRGFEVVDVALAIGRIPLDPFVLTGIGADAAVLRISGYARENDLLLDLGVREGLALELVAQKVTVAQGTVIARVSGGAEAQAIANRGTILGDVALGAGDDVFANSGTVGGIVRGGAGDDTYVVDAGFRMIEAAGGGTDTVIASVDHRLANNIENLTLTGAAGLRGTGNALANVLTGSVGDDVLSGLAGNDTLIGGGGRDVLTGGAGADLFVFGPGDSAKSAAGADRITDFVSAQGDRIDLSGFDGALAFIGTAAFSAAGQVRFEAVGGTTFVMGDVDGDGRADFQIRLAGDLALTAGDFVL